MEYLCKCNNCETIMFDENPQTDAVKKELTGKEEHMVQVEENGEYFWACPVCRTDDYLIDLK